MLLLLVYDPTNMSLYLRQKHPFLVALTSPPLARSLFMTISHIFVPQPRKALLTSASTATQCTTQPRRCMALHSLTSHALPTSCPQHCRLLLSFLAPSRCGVLAWTASRTVRSFSSTPRPTTAFTPSGSTGRASGTGYSEQHSFVISSCKKGGLCRLPARLHAQRALLLA